MWNESRLLRGKMVEKLLWSFFDLEVLGLVVVSFSVPNDNLVARRIINEPVPLVFTGDSDPVSRLKEFFNVERDILFEACGFGDIVLSCTIIVSDQLCAGMQHAHCMAAKYLAG